MSKPIGLIVLALSLSWCVTVNLCELSEFFGFSCYQIGAVETACGYAVDGVDTIYRLLNYSSVRLVVLLEGVFTSVIRSCRFCWKDFRASDSDAASQR